jgi:hypothetical protein
LKNIKKHALTKVQNGLYSTNHGVFVQIQQEIGVFHTAEVTGSSPVPPRMGNNGGTAFVRVDGQRIYLSRRRCYKLIEMNVNTRKNEGLRRLNQQIPGITEALDRYADCVILTSEREEYSEESAEAICRPVQGNGNCKPV